MDTPKKKQKPETVHLDIETVSEDGNNKALQAAGHADRTPPRPPVFISASDPAALKQEMIYNRGLNFVIEAENPVQAVVAKRNALLGGKTVQVINDFHEPAKQEARDAVVKAFREAKPGTSVLIYVRPPSPALEAIMEDHPEIKEEMSSKLSEPSDLLS